LAASEFQVERLEKKRARQSQESRERRTTAR
jgi:hypothetical protein